MRRTLLVFLAILLVMPLLSGCFYYPYPYYDDGYGRGYYRHDRGYYDGRDYDGRHDGQRDGYRDYRDRR